MGISKLDIAEEKENPLLNRKEYRVKITQEGSTPSRKEISDAVKGKIKANQELVIVDRVNQHYGKKQCTVYVKVYKSKEALEKIEPKYKVERMAGKPQEQATAEEEAKPAEKEDKPQEKKESKPEAKKEEEK